MGYPAPPLVNAPFPRGSAAASGLRKITHLAPDFAPAWGVNLVVLLIAITAIRLHEIFPFLMALRPALVVGIGGAALLWLTSGRTLRRAALSDVSVRWAAAYLLWAAFTVPFALWPGMGASTVRAFLPALFLVVAIQLLVPTKNSLLRLCTGLVAAAGIYAAALLTMGNGLVDERKELGASLDANDLACLLAMVFPFALGLVARATGWRRWLGLGVAALIAVATTVTGSRGGTIAILVTALVYAFGWRGVRKFIVISVLVVAGFGAWRLAPPTYRDRMTALASGEEDYNTTEYGGRKQIWARARTYIRQHPVVGVGVGNFPVAEGYYLEELGSRGKWSAAHNAYYQAFAELGFPGGLLFVGLILLTARRAARYWRQPKGSLHPQAIHQPELLASILAYAVGSYFLSLAYFYALFALVGIVAFADRVGVRMAPCQLPLPVPAGPRNSSPVSRRHSSSSIRS